MDNITHSLVGVLAGRVLPDDSAASAEPAGSGSRAHRPKTGRAVFWALLLSSNIPDIDVVANFFVEPLTALQYHRSFTHSLPGIPLLALVPAFVVHLATARAGFRRLWICSMAGILFHIFIDLITPYGTQILFPFSETRFSLDWMFIIDPWFTGILTLLLAAGKIFPRRRAVLGYLSVAFALLYLGAEYRFQSVALGIFRDELRKSGRETLTVSVLPQPLSILKWVGLATTDSGVVRQYIELLSDGGVSEPEYFPNDTDRFASKASRTEFAGEYLRFARFPTLETRTVGDFHTVEFRDLQFSVDPRIAKAVGLGERDIPFVLRLEFDRSEMPARVTFNDRPVPLRR
ncbi:MAG TPA: metal-dependent hydrolase [Bacteroidota bacterium]|nr:metal-dependent hydrolase [Bacteroidota bacterium]